MKKLILFLILLFAIDVSAQVKRSSLWYMSNATTINPLSSTWSLAGITNIGLSGNIVPSVTNTSNLGSSSYIWNLIYGDTLNVNAIKSTFTAGSVVFAVTDGVFSEDNSNFFWDNVNKRLGIRTTSPEDALHVAGTGRITNRLGVGGSPAANAQFHVLGTFDDSGLGDAWGVHHSSTLEASNGYTAFAFGTNPTISAPVGETVNAAGLAVYDISKSGTGTIGNMYGLYIRAMSGAATNKWGIYDASGANAYITGNVSIGTTDLDGTPIVGKLTVKSSTNDGSTYPLMLRDSDEANIFGINSNGDLISQVTNTSVLGSADYIWNTGYLGTLTLGDDSDNVNGTLSLVSAGNAQANIAINDSDQITFNGGTYVFDNSMTGTFGATSKLLLDGSTTGHTGTDGLLDLNMTPTSAALGTVMADMSLSSPATGIGATTHYGINLSFTGDSDDNASSIVHLLQFGYTPNSSPASVNAIYNNDADFDYFIFEDGGAPSRFDGIVYAMNNANAMQFGDDASDVDVVLNFKANTADGTITFMEDEDRFDFDNDVDIVADLTVGTIQSDATVKATTMVGNVAQQTITLGVGATTFAVTSNVITVTGDAGANTIATITGAVVGTYVFIFVDGLVTITDDDAHASNSIDLAGTATNFTSADDKVLMLTYDGTSWHQPAPASQN